MREVNGLIKKAKEIKRKQEREREREREKERKKKKRERREREKKREINKVKHNPKWQTESKIDT